MEIKNVVGKYLQPGRSWYQRAVAGIKIITVHHTASRTQGTNEAKLKALMQTHTNNGWPGLAYHFVITQDGTIYQVNNFTDVTWHDSFNWDSVGVALVGYFAEPYNEVPTEKQLVSLRELLDNLCTQHPEFPAAEANVFGHRERSATACPGTLLPKVVEYRTKLGDVDWGQVGIDYKKKYEDLLKDHKIALEHVNNFIGAMKDIKEIAEKSLE